jgi:hypothetical protein
MSLHKTEFTVAGLPVWIEVDDKMPERDKVWAVRNAEFGIKTILEKSQMLYHVSPIAQKPR